MIGLYDDGDASKERPEFPPDFDSACCSCQNENPNLEHPKTNPYTHIHKPPNPTLSLKPHSLQPKLEKPGCIEIYEHTSIQLLNYWDA